MWPLRRVVPTEPITQMGALRGAGHTSQTDPLLRLAGRFMARRMGALAGTVGVVAARGARLSGGSGHRVPAQVDHLPQPRRGEVAADPGKRGVACGNLHAEAVSMR